MSYLLLEDGSSHLLLEDGSGALLLEDGSTSPGWEGANVIAATIAWWLGTPAMMALTSDGQLWHKTAPEDTQLPYATVFLASEVNETWTTAYPWRRSSVQINLHAATDAAAAALGLAVRDTFKDSPLLINSIPVAHVLPDGDGIDVGEGLGLKGRDCWVAFETFDIPWTTQ